MKALIVGCGGIGSYFIEHLQKAMLNNQIPIKTTEIQIVDNDTVEMKNILYQNFTDKDVLKNKAEVLGDRYDFYGVNKRIETEEDLKGFDMFIICADNAKVRKLIYNHCYSDETKSFIDLRAEGRQIAVITSELGQDEALSTLPKQTNDKNGSCQIKYEFEELKWIQYGNVIVAAMGLQTLVNKVRNETFNPKTIMRV